MKLLLRLGMLDTMTLWRVREQLKATAPDDITFVKDERDADAQVIFAIGASGVAKSVKSMPTILLQLCFKTTEMPKEWWEKLWEECLFVGSYFNLEAPNFVRFPMGYDPKLFYRDGSTERRYDAIVFGDLDGQEEIVSVCEAFETVAHVGADFNLGVGYVNYRQILDSRLRQIYTQSKYCIGLRKVEGFEMPIIEGAACGCIPITFDLECYRHWFDGMAMFLDPNDDAKKQMVIINEMNLGVVPGAGAIACFQQDIAWKPFWEKVEETLG